MKPDVDTIKSDLRQHLIDTYLPGEDPANLTDELELQQSGVLDSVSTLELVQHLETTYNVSINAHEIATRLNSIHSIVALVVEKSG